MKIAINLLYLLPGEVGGTETYGICLLDAISKMNNSDEYIVYLNRESSNISIPIDTRIKYVICSINAKNRIFRYIYEQFRLPFLLWKHRVNLVHSLGYVGPIVTHCKSVVTIPDTNYYDVRENFSPLRRLFLTMVSTLAARHSNQVVTISEFSKRQIHKHIGIPFEKITVTHLGPGWLEKPAQPVNWDTLKTKYSLPEKYIIVFGGGARHKNIQRLLEAYDNQVDIHDHSLVIIGRLPEGVVVPTPAEEGQIGSCVQCLGFVPTEHIQPLLSHASLFVLPSLYEGFGLPILEAQHAGVPVASSFAASLPEIGGEGAIYFDPTSVEAIVSALKQALWQDSEKAETLRIAAQANLSRFSWAGTAKSSVDVYRKVLGRG